MINSLQNWDLQIDLDVYKILKRIPRDNAEKILGVIKFLPANQYFGDIQKMKGKDDVWRRRIGSYRIFYKIKLIEKSIIVFYLERRKSKTY